MVIRLAMRFQNIRIGKSLNWIISIFNFINCDLMWRFLGLHWWELSKTPHGTSADFLLAIFQFCNILLLISFDWGKCVLNLLPMIDWNWLVNKMENEIESGSSTMVLLTSWTINIVAIYFIGSWVFELLEFQWITRNLINLMNGIDGSTS